MSGDHKARNRQTWVALQESGFVPGSGLVVDVFFFASAESAIMAVAEELTARGWSAEVSAAASKGLFKREPEYWAIKASCKLEEVQLDVLDAMVDEFEALAVTHNADFDGWGALVGH